MDDFDLNYPEELMEAIGDAFSECQQSLHENTKEIENNQHSGGSNHE